jgi:hypothetical protein
VILTKEIVQHTIMFHGNGGSPTLNTVTVNDGATLGSQWPIPTYPGWIFDGWNTSANQSGTWLRATTPVESNLEVWAIWHQVAPPTESTPTTEPTPSSPSTPFNPAAPSGGDETFEEEETPLGNLEGPLPFTDVSEQDWYYDAVSYLSQNQLVAGTSLDHFSPTVSMSRGMLISILYQFAGKPSVSTESVLFNDIAGGYYQDAAIWAGDLGIVGGYGDGRFGPDNQISRQDLLVILYQYAKQIGAEFPVVRAGIEFDDGESIAEYAKEAVNAFYQAEMISGKPGNRFDPKAAAKRSEVAVILYHFINGLNIGG